MYRKASLTLQPDAGEDEGNTHTLKPCNRNPETLKPEKPQTPTLQPDAGEDEGNTQTLKP
jgi:hypothetical protein